MKMEWGAARREEMVRKEHMLMEQRSKEATNSRWGLSFPRGRLSLSPSPHNDPVCPPQREVSFVFTFLRNLPFIPLLSTRFAAVNLPSSLLHNHMGSNTPRCSVEQREVPSVPSFPCSWKVLAVVIHAMWWADWASGEFQVSFWAPPDTFLQRWSQTVDEDSQRLFQEQCWPVCPAAERPRWSLDSLPSGEEWAGFLEHSPVLGPLC